MANTKITSLTELAATPAATDVFPIVDVSDTTMAGTGTTKKIQASRFSYLAATQTFTASQTISPTGTMLGLTINVPNVTVGASQEWSYAGTRRIYTVTHPTGSQLGLDTTDLGSGNRGPVIVIGANNNATTAVSGSLGITDRAGIEKFIWPDQAGNLRIHTAAPISFATDTAGTVVGTQTSNLASKDVKGKFTDYKSALQTILATELYNFTYKSGSYNGQEFTGIITDHSPIFGMDKDEEFPNGKSLNEVTAIGYCMAAIKALNEEIEVLKSQVLELQSQKT